MSTTDLFVDYLLRKVEKIEEKQRKKADQCLKDYLAVTKAGAVKNRDKWSGILDHLEAGKAQLVGYDQTTDLKTAALINGFNAHTLELDDGQRFAMIHLGAAVISALLSAKAKFHIHEAEMRTGIIMGYEAACRTAIAMQPSHKQKGYHTAGTCGTIGAAVGVGFALQMDEGQLKKVITAAAGSSAGLLEIQEQASEMKPYNLGRAAMDGLTSAFMGLTDFDTPDDMLGGERGFFNVASDHWSAEKLTEDQDYFEIDRIYVKPYVSCRHSHSAVEAAIQLHEKIDPADIDRVEVCTYKLAVKGHDHRKIQGVASAKLSTPYAVASGLLYGTADLDNFEPLDPEIVKLAEKIEVVEDPDFTKESPGKRIAEVHVWKKYGTKIFYRVDYAKGEPENPMTDEELEKKWTSLEEFAKSGGTK